jgi:hypothetical protein
VLGLLVNPTSKLTITAMGTQDENNTGHGLWVTHYLRLDGDIDLIGESQLVQKRYTPAQVNGSFLDVNSSGYLKRDQQGTTNFYNYNYWGPPVGPQIVGSINDNYTIGSILNDGTISSSPQTISWTSGYDALPTTPITLSRRWVWAYENYPENVYAEWSYKTETGYMAPGLGFIMKGSGAAGFDPLTYDPSNLQNYVFRGEPYNSTIMTPINPVSDALVGNPYASAIDANEFIRDNIPGGNPGTSASTTGILYFWEHFNSNFTHILEDYEGGYAVYSLAGGVEAITPPPTNDGFIIIGGNGTVRPSQYIPVGQGFFVNADANLGGMITFKNSQRIFMREGAGSSVFFRSANNTDPNDSKEGDDLIKRIRLNFKSPEGSIRPLLLAFVPNSQATDGFDYGYDAKFYDDKPLSYMAWMINDEPYVIQGVGDYDKSKQYPLELNIATSGLIEIELTDLENFKSYKNVYVYDSLLGTYTKINNKSYKISLDAGEYSNRFYITFTKAKNDGILDITENELENAVVNYLNNSNEIYIRVPEGVNVKQVYLVNLIGQAIKSWNITNTTNLSGSEIRIPVSRISEGTYIVNVETDTYSFNKKIIINY